MTASKRIFFAVLCLIGASSGSWAQDTPGAYLALRYAFFHSDDAAVAKFVEDALGENPENVEMLQQAVISDVFYGDIENAYMRSRALEALDEDSLFSALASFGYLINSGQFTEASEFVQASGSLNFIDHEILDAWALSEEGQVDEAVDLLARTAQSAGEGAPIFDYQSAMILANNGRFDEAATRIAPNGAEPIYFSNDSFYAHMSMLIQAGEIDAATDELTKNFGDETLWPYLTLQIVESARDRKTPDSLSFASPQNAIAEYVSFVLGAATRDSDVDPYSQRFFITLLPSIAPNHDGLIVDALRFFERNEEHDDLLLYAERISDDTPFRLARDELVANTLLRLDQDDDARKIIERTEDDTIDALHFRALGFDRISDFQAAVDNYDAAINIAGETPSNWSLFYGRAFAFERLGDWEQARASAETALRLAPEEPEVLNYLGYSLVDRKVEIERGLELINKAIELAPERGHIQDSLGWAYYRLGRYDEALEPLERSSFLIPTEPVVYSHLGDLYWQLGRKREAEHMWRRALVFIDEDTVDTSIEEINARLETGQPPSE